MPTRRVKPVAKKKVTRRAKAGNALAWPVTWIRLVSGEELIARAKHTSGGVFMQDPTVMTYSGNVLMLSLYALVTDDPTLFVDRFHVLHSSNASAAITRLYEATLKLSDIVLRGYEGTLERSIRLAENTLKPYPEPTDRELAVIEAAEAMKGRERADEGPSPRSRERSIDDLVQLAESLGKGKNAGG